MKSRVKKKRIKSNGKCKSVEEWRFFDILKGFLKIKYTIDRKKILLSQIRTIYFRTSASWNLLEPRSHFLQRRADARTINSTLNFRISPILESFLFILRSNDRSEQQVKIKLFFSNSSRGFRLATRKLNCFFDPWQFSKSFVFELVRIFTYIRVIWNCLNFV